MRKQKKWHLVDKKLINTGLILGLDPPKNSILRNDSTQQPLFGSLLLIVCKCC